MKYFLLGLFILLSIYSAAQEQRRIVNSEGVPIPFATIGFLPDQRNFTANEEGFFPYSSELTHDIDSIRISQIGYKTKTISLAQLKRFPIVALDRAIVDLSDIEVTTLNQKDLASLIYEAFEKRRESDFSNYMHASLKVRTSSEEQVFGLFEAFGNLTLDKAGLPERWVFTYADYRILPGFNFYRINTSDLILSFSFFERSETSPWPLHPGRLGKRDLRKRFKIEPTSATENEEKQYLVEYTLRAKEDDYLSAKVLINQENHDIIRYEIFGEKLERHPFEPIFKKQENELGNFKLTTTFNSDLTRLSCDYTIDGQTTVRTSIKLIPLHIPVKSEPLLFHDVAYNDYELAELLSYVLDKKDQTYLLNHSFKDRNARQLLGSNKVKSALAFWDKENPITISAFSSEEAKINKGSIGPSNHEKISDPFEVLPSGYNAALIPVGSKFIVKAFVDTVNSETGLKRSIETALLVNLAFDEYKYAADRVALASSISDAKRLLKTERKEVSLRLSRLLSSRDFVSLLDRNFMNYQKHGVDRFYGLNREKCESQIFTELPKHLNPTDPSHLAVAYLLSEKYDNALRLAAAKGTDMALWHYIEAVAHFFSKNCAAFQLALQKAVKGGYPVSESAFGPCR